jgi:hypothetical protein
LVSKVALLIAAAVLVPLAVGVLAGAVMDPHGPWKGTFEVAAAASGVVAGLALVAIFVGLVVAEPSECAHGVCNGSDNAAAVQAIAIVPLLVPNIRSRTSRGCNWEASRSHP